MGLINFLLIVALGTCLGDAIYDDYDESREVRSYQDVNTRQGQRVQGKCNACVCSQEYIPFCGTDGVTYNNKCELECAQNCDGGLGVKFEGVCPVPYIHNDGSRQQNHEGLPRPVQVGTRPITVVDKNLGYNNNEFYVTPRPSYKIPIYTFPTTRRYGDEFDGRYPTTTPRYGSPTGRYQIPINTFPTTRRYGDEFGRYPINTTPNPTRSPPSFPVSRPLGRYQQWLATSTERTWFVPREPYLPPHNNRLDWR